MGGVQGPVSRFLGVGPAPVSPPSHGCSPLPLICGSDDDRANLMWKRYLEREDSKIVGTERAKPWGQISVWGGAGLGDRLAP